MIHAPDATERARILNMAPAGEDRWEALESDIPPFGIAQRRGDRNDAMVPIEDLGPHRVTAEDVQRYHKQHLTFVVGAWFHRILWRDANPDELAILTANEEQERQYWADFEQRRNTWNEIKNHFVTHGEAQPENRYPNGDLVVDVVDALNGNYYVVLLPKKWMWWVQQDRLTREQVARGRQAPCVAYRLKWDPELAHRIESTPQMPHLANSYL